MKSKLKKLKADEINSCYYSIQSLFYSYLKTPNVKIFKTIILLGTLHECEIGSHVIKEPRVDEMSRGWRKIRHAVLHHEGRANGNAERRPYERQMWREDMD